MPGVFPSDTPGFVYTESTPRSGESNSRCLQPMNALVAAVAQHGYVLMFAILFAEGIGFPFPAAIALIAAGAAIPSHALSAWGAMAAALIALLAADTIQFWLGRYTGWALLGFLCRLSMNPETCMLRSAESFYKRGKTTLIIAKFIPGINTMAAPLAGSMKMRFTQFLQLDLVGALLYTSTYLLIGYICRDFLAATLRSFYAAGRVMEFVILGAVLVYVLYRIAQFLRYREYNVVPRVQADELARRIAAGEADKIQIVDVRSHGYYDRGAERIFGSIRIEPNNLDEEIKDLSREKDIYLYCT
jgi:membrane protein DedA with SNARE-associated domain